MFTVPQRAYGEVGVASHSRLVVSAIYYAVVRQVNDFPRAVVEVLSRWRRDLSIPPPSTDPSIVCVVAVVALSDPTSIGACVLPDGTRTVFAAGATAVVSIRCTVLA